MNSFALVSFFVAALLLVAVLAAFVINDLLLREGSLGGLLEGSSGGNWFGRYDSPLSMGAEKRSLLNQQIYKRSYA